MNEIKDGENLWCCVCNKPLRASNNLRWVHLLTTGEYAAYGSPRHKTEESQGWFVIGNDCFKKLKDVDFLVGLNPED